MINTLDDFNHWEEMKNKVIHADALELLKKLPDNSVYIVTDPPYGMNYSNRGQIGDTKIVNTKKYKKSDWDKNIPSQELFNEMFRVSKNIIIFGANHFSEINLPKSNGWITWDKCNGESHFGDSEIIYTDIKMPPKIIPFMWFGMFQGKGIGKGNYQSNKSKNEKRYHITQKPLILIRHLIIEYFKDVSISICDPFSGSFTTAKACQELGRDFIGCDLDMDYCRIGEQRLAEQILFTV